MNMKSFKDSLKHVFCFAVVFALVNPFLTASDNRVKDQDITLAIEAELLADDSVSAHMIDVETTQGVVTLTGTVGNILSKEKSTRIAENIRGVRAVVNRITVRPVIRPDEEIREDVEQALLKDPATDSFEIDVKVTNGMVTLTGTVESWAEKNLSALVAKGVSGVRDLRNQIDIAYRVNRLDQEIEKEIERRLETDTFVDDALIKVDVENGDVKLAGTVGSAAEKSRAYFDAWVAGVESIDDDNLEVKWWAMDKLERHEEVVIKSDEAIKKAVEDAFFYDPRVYSFEPRVDVNQGIVTLSGVVGNLKALEAAEEDARATVGVVDVINNLKVRFETGPTDTEIEDNVEQALSWDPFLERHDISVTVLNNKVYLYGNVDTEFEKDHASDVAARVRGAAEVQNNLAVLSHWQWKSDGEIKEDVIEEFFWSLVVDGDDITVAVDDGVVTLDGAVDDWHEHDLAVKNAFEAGAKQVHSLLDIKFGTTAFNNDRMYYTEPLTWY